MIIIIFILIARILTEVRKRDFAPSDTAVGRARIHTQTWLLSLNTAQLHCPTLSLFPLFQSSQLVRICHNSETYSSSKWILLLYKVNDHISDVM